MTTFWNILKVVLPLLLQLGGLLFGGAAVMNSGRVADPKAPTINEEARTTGQGALGATMIAAGAAWQLGNHLSKPASPVTPPSTPIHITGDDIVVKSLLQANQQISDELKANIAALTAKAQKEQAANNAAINVRKGS